MGFNALSQRPPLHSATASMGSLGWAQCYWCWRWEFNMYISDGIEAPLCCTCLNRCISDAYTNTATRPPWQPDGITRAQRHLVAIMRSTELDDAAWELVATFLVSWWIP